MGWLKKKTKKEENKEVVRIPKKVDIKTLMYSSLDDMPIYNWFKLSNESDYNQLLKVYDKVVTEKNVHIFEERSNQLTQEYLDRFGANQDSEYLLILLKSKIRLQTDLILTGNKFIKIQINQVEEQIKNLLPPPGQVVDVEESLVAISEVMHYGIFSKTTSVVRYKYLTNLIDKKNKEAERWQKNR